MAEKQTLASWYDEKYGKMPNASLFEQLGGTAAVDAAVDIFYRKVLGDDRINRFFEGVDMEKQAAKQKAFLTMASGGRTTTLGKTCAKATPTWSSKV